jgi:hypothetical protein
MQGARNGLKILLIFEVGGEGGILVRELLKIPVLMVKTKCNRVKHYLGEIRFPIDTVKSDLSNFDRFLTEPLRNMVIEST